MERPLIELRTNLRSITDRYLSWQLNWGLGLASCAYVLRDHYSHFAVSTSYSDGDERAHGRELPDGGHPQILNRLNSADVNFMSVGGEARRIDKIDAIADWEVAQTALRVCWENRGQAFNCGACEKCLRTMAALAALGRLDKFDVFNRPLDCQVLARSVPTHPSVIAFAKENLATARSRNADPELIVALERYLEGPHPRYRRLWQQYAPRKLKAWLYQRGY